MPHRTAEAMTTMTTRRSMHLIAARLGLEEGDWDPEKAYALTIADLERLALRKIIRKRHESALILQRKWMGFHMHKTTKELLAARRAAARRIQSWWRARCCRRKEVEVRHNVAVQLQAAARGWLVRVERRRQLAATAAAAAAATTTPDD